MSNSNNNGMPPIGNIIIAVILAILVFIAFYWCARIFLAYFLLNWIANLF